MESRQNNNLTKNIPTKDLSNKIVLGFAQWGEKAVPTEEMIFLIKEAIKKYGINEIDCAPHYGNGAREATLGVALLDLQDHFNVSISTKIGRTICPDSVSKNSNGFVNPSPQAQICDYSGNGILLSFYQSLLRLLRNKIQTLYLHDLDRATHGDSFDLHMKEFLEDGGCEALSSLKQSGYVHTIGIGSNHYQSCMELVRLKRFPVDRIMLAGCYNLLNFDALEKFFPFCMDNNVELYLAAPYCGGLLSDEPGNQAYRYQQASPEILNRVSKLKGICNEFKVALSHAALQFVLMHPQAKKVVVGPRTREELAMTMKYAREPIAQDFWLALKQHGLIPKNAPTEMTEQTRSDLSIFTRAKEKPDEIKISLDQKPYARL